MADRIRELDGGQEILTQKIERLERALRAALNGKYNTASAFDYAESILDETFPI